MYSCAIQAFNAAALNSLLILVYLYREGCPQTFLLVMQREWCSQYSGGNSDWDGFTAFLQDWQGYKLLCFRASSNRPWGQIGLTGDSEKVPLGAGDPMPVFCWVSCTSLWSLGHSPLWERGLICCSNAYVLPFQGGVNRYGMTLKNRAVLPLNNTRWQMAKSPLTVWVLHHVIEEPGWSGYIFFFCVVKSKIWLVQNPHFPGTETHENVEEKHSRKCKLALRSSCNIKLWYSQGGLHKNGNMECKEEQLPKTPLDSCTEVMVSVLISSYHRGDSWLLQMTLV